MSTTDTCLTSEHMSDPITGESPAAPGSQESLLGSRNVSKRLTTAEVIGGHEGANRDRRSAVLQLRDQLERVLEEEGRMPGWRLPSEAQLCERFAFSRGTVREALKLLEQDGLIDVQHGRGRFISALGGLKVDRPITRFESATDMLTGRGYDPTTKVLALQRRKPDAQERSELDLAPGQDVVQLERLRLHRDSALIYSVNVFSAALLRDDPLSEDDFTASLTDWLADRGHQPTSSAAQIQVGVLPAHVAAMPEVGADEAWLSISERCVDERGVSVVLSREYYRGDVFSFHVLRRSTP
jgi:GntR family transcriptional regulator